MPHDPWLEAVGSLRLWVLWGWGPASIVLSAWVIRDMVRDLSRRDPEA